MVLFHSGSVVFQHLIHLKTESFPLISSRCAAFIRFLTSRRIETCLSPNCTHSADKCEFGLVLSCLIVDAFVTLANVNPLIRRNCRVLLPFCWLFLSRCKAKISLDYKWSISNCGRTYLFFSVSLKSIWDKHLVDLF